MSASKRCKDLGAPNLEWVAKMYGCSASNLQKKYAIHPDKFDIIVMGCLAIDGGAILKARIEEIMSFL